MKKTDLSSWKRLTLDSRAGRPAERGFNVLNDLFFLSTILFSAQFLAHTHTDETSAQDPIYGPLRGGMALA